jgi:uncharacterized protein YmfQ (DUF2313 family)
MAREPTLTPDRHIRRTGDDYASAFLTLLPQGQAWPKAPGSTLERACNGLSQYWGYVDERAAILLEIDSDPRKTRDTTDVYGVKDGLLPEWERAWGLPDECFPAALTVPERQKMLIQKMTWLGAQSRQYFIELAAWLGLEIYIKEFSPFMAGISQVGDTREPPPDSPVEKQNFRWYIGPPEQRFVWSINVGQIGLRWFRAAGGEAGVHHHLEFMLPEETVCLLERWKPAHTVIIPDYSEITAGGPMQGTP